MSSAFIKPKLKLLKESLAVKDWNAVLKYSTDVLGFESSNYNARVFLALAYFNLERFDEAEESYKKAIESAPTQPLARQGLAGFYEKRQRFSDYAWCLLELMELFENTGEAIKFAETLQKLIEVRRSHGTRLELVDALSYLLPTSPSRDLLASLPPANPTSPTASTVHSIQMALISFLPTLLEVLSILEKEESQAVEAEIKKRRQRLGGQTMSANETKKAVESEKMRGSRLVGLYQSILNDPDASGQEALRRDIENRLLIHLRTLLAALPSSLDPTSLDLTAVPKRKDVLLAEEEDKKQARDEAEELARGMVLIRVPQESAWSVVLEWGDMYAEWTSIHWIELNDFASLFPETGLAKIILASYNRLPNRAVDQDDVASEGISADQMVGVIEQGLEISPDSLVGHLLSVQFFSQEEEWDSVAVICEAGLAVLERIQSEIGRTLSRSRRTLESHLAIALVHLNPPTHHLRALRLLDPLIASSVTPNSRLLTAKAYLLQYSEKWSEAIGIWDLVLEDVHLSHDVRLAVRGERGWSLVKAGEIIVAESNLLEVVDALEQLKSQRDLEKIAKERIRSKAGIERAEGVQEGETTAESSNRARAWWRLGICRWEMCQTNPSQSTPAYEAFSSSIRACPTYAPPFTSLGVYYRSLVTPNLDRASKCFQKAFELDGGEELAARYLAEEFSDSGDWDLVELIARRVVDRSRGKAALGGKVAQRLSWAFKAIGGAELNSKKYTQAIIAFQSALRGAPQDVHTWIKLGIAYRSAGKHIAALKVFAKATTIDSTYWYTHFLIGDVQREIGLLEPAIKAFRSILLDRPNDMGVRVVLAETTLSRGQEEFQNGYYARAEQSYLEALQEATRIISSDSGIRMAWKVAADALIGLGSMVDLESIEVALSLASQLLSILEGQQIDEKIKGMDVVTTISVQALLESDSPSPTILSAVSTLACKMRVLLETQNEAAIGSAWLDLGISISVFRKQLLTTKSATTAEEALDQAIRCLKFALHKEPMNSIFWNALGVLSFDLSPRLAQHSFIKSIEYNSRSAVPWTNLGIFYLVHGDHDLANQALLKAQVIDPDWSAAWIGQASLAASAGHVNESATLFEHAFTLPGHLPEADIGFATSAFARYRAAAFSSSNDPTSKPSTEILSAPIFALSRYLALRPNDVSALHLNALLLEQVGDLPTACESLEKAATLLEELYEVDESAVVETQFVIAQTNLGRVRLASLDYVGALSAFEAALSLLSTDERDTSGETGVAGGLSRSESILLLTECRLGSGIAHHLLDPDSDNAIEALERGLEDIEGVGGSKRAEIDIALGRIHWSRDQEHETAIACFLDTPDVFTEGSPSFVKLTLQALGIVAQDRGILEAGDRTRKNPLIKYHPEMTRLLAARKLVSEDRVGAVSVLERSIFAAPWAPRRRMALASLLIRLGPLDSSPTLSSSQSKGKTAIERLLRARLLFDENGEERAIRLRLIATGKIVERGEGEKDLVLELMEKSLHLTPWGEQARQGLDAAKEFVKG